MLYILAWLGTFDNEFADWHMITSLTKSDFECSKILALCCSITLTFDDIDLRYRALLFRFIGRNARSIPLVTWLISLRTRLLISCKRGFTESSGYLATNSITIDNRHFHMRKRHAEHFVINVDTFFPTLSIETSAQRVICTLCVVSRS